MREGAGNIGIYLLDHVVLGSPSEAVSPRFSPPARFFNSKKSTMDTDKNPADRNLASELFGEPIHIYSRAQGIADGVLIDVTATAKEAGFRHPTAITAALWQVIVTIPARYPFEDVEGRLWDCIWMARQQAGKCKEGNTRFFLN